MNDDIFIFDKSGTILTGVRDRSITSAIIPDGVTCIGNWAFKDCWMLTSIIIPNSVTSIGEYAFEGCVFLTSIDIPDSVTSIGNRAFYKCSSLTSIVIPDSVTSIGNDAFSGCKSLTSIDIPNSVKNIGKELFLGCSSLTSIVVDKGNSVFDSRDNCNAIIETATNILILGCMSSTIPNSVTNIGDRAFQYCTGLTSIDIPDSVTSIGDEAFKDCSLISIVVDNENSVFDSRDNCNAIIETATNILILGCMSSTIPNSVTSIGDYAFWDCMSLTSIDIPDSVTSIGSYAFYGCISLRAIHSNIRIIENTDIENSAFWSVNTDECTLFVPPGTRWAYRHHPVFGKFKNIEIETKREKE